MTTPTIEPASFVAGDTLTWTKHLADYPAGAWTLKYRLLNAAGKIDITATASGTDHLVSVSAATTAGYTAGDYDYLAWVEKSGERVSIGQGRIKVIANLAALNTYDGRSPARKIYDGLLAAYQSRVDGGQGFVQEYEIAGRRMKFTTAADWLNQMNYWKAQVAAEDRAAKIAAGLATGNRVMVRF
jgi:hypothetical protein